MRREAKRRSYSSFPSSSSCYSCHALKIQLLLIATLHSIENSSFFLLKEKPKEKNHKSAFMRQFAGLKGKNRRLDAHSSFFIIFFLISELILKKRRKGI